MDRSSEAAVPTEGELQAARAALADTSAERWLTLVECAAALEPLRDLPEGYGGWGGGQDLGGGVRQMPFAMLSREASAALEAVDAFGIPAPQQWMDWDEGRRIVREHSLIPQTEPAICALLIGTLRRNDRFSEGALLSAFESGLMPLLLAGMLRAAPNSEHSG